MTIERLLLINFQKFKRRGIRFDPYVTVFTGDTDAGKSTFLRSLWWLATNPRGDFTRHGTSYCEVKALVDGRTIRRSRKGNQNKYRLGRRRFKAFRRSVPKDINDLLRVADLNFQDQHDPAFWFSLTPGQLSRELNEIVDLGTIDRVLANCAVRIRKAKAAVETSETRLEVARKQRESLAWVNEAASDYEHVEQLHRNAKAARASLAAAESKVSECINRRSAMRRSAAASSEAEVVLSLGETAARHHKQSHSLQSLVKSIQRMKARSERCRRKLTKLKRELRRSTKGKCPVCGSQMKSSRLLAPISTCPTHHL